MRFNYKITQCSKVKLEKKLIKKKTKQIHVNSG
jgi:glutamate mutase epsilon subunit